MDNPLLDIYDIMKLIKVTKSTIFRYIKAGKIPEPIKLTPTTMRWKREEIEEWIKNLK